MWVVPVSYQLCHQSHSNLCPRPSRSRKRGVNFSYGTKTTTGGMRYHLLLVHHEVYLEACERNGWKKHLPIMNRYDFERARQAAKNRDFQKSVEKSVADWVEAANLVCLLVTVDVPGRAALN
jgi:hypothetical protein